MSVEQAIRACNAEFKDADFTVGDKVGNRSGNGDVYKLNNTMLCVKVLQRPNENTAQARLGREIAALKLLAATGLVPLLHTAAAWFFVMEFLSDFLCIDYLCGGYQSGSLWRALPSPYDVRLVLRNLLNAIAIVHSNFLVHRDIKANNVMIARDSSVKLIDFGLCARIESSDDDAIDAALMATVTQLDEPFKNALVQLPEFAADSDIHSRRYPASDVTLCVALYAYMKFGVRKMSLEAARGHILQNARKVTVQENYICLRAFRSSIAERFETASAVIAALDFSEDQAAEAIREHIQSRTSNMRPLNDIVASRIRNLLSPCLRTESRLRWSDATVGTENEEFSYAKLKFRCCVGVVTVEKKATSIKLPFDHALWRDKLLVFLGPAALNETGNNTVRNIAVSSSNANDDDDESTPVEED